MCGCIKSPAWHRQSRPLGRHRKAVVETLESERRLKACPNCGAQNPAWAQLCGQCGYSFLAEAETQAAGLTGPAAYPPESTAPRYERVAPPRGRGPLVVAALAALVLLLAGGSYFTINALRGAPAVDTARAIPANAPGVMGMSLGADPEILYASAKATMQLSGNKEPEWLTSLRDNMKADGVDLEADVLPWLGRNMNVSVSPRAGADDAPAEGDPLQSELLPQVDVLFTVAVKDEAAARAGMRKILQARATDEAQGSVAIEESTYKGVTILSATGGEGPDAPSAAVTERMALFAGRPEAVQGGIDRLQGGGTNIAQSEEYKRVQRNLPGDRTVWMFVDGKALTESLGDLNPADRAEAAGVPTDSLFGAALSPVEGGNAVNFYTYAPDTRTVPPAETTAPSGVVGEELASYAPAESYFFFAARNLATWWQGVRDRLDKGGEDDPQAALLGGFFSQLEERTGLSLDRNFFNAFTGEYGMAVTPTDRASSIADGLAILIETPDAAAARRFVDDVRGSLEKRFVPIVRNDVAGREAYFIDTGSPGESSPGLLVGDGYIALGASEAALAQVPTSGANLGSQPEFQRGVRNLARRQGGVMHIQVQSMLDSIFKGPPESRANFEKNPVGGYISRLRTVTMGTETKGDESWGNILLYTRPVEAR